MFRRLICQSEFTSQPKHRVIGFFKSWKSFCLATLLGSTTVLTVLQADVTSKKSASKQSPDEKKTPIEILTPSTAVDIVMPNQSLLINDQSTAIEVIKGTVTSSESVRGAHSVADPTNENSQQIKGKATQRVAESPPEEPTDAASQVDASNSVPRSKLSRSQQDPVFIIRETLQRSRDRRRAKSLPSLESFISAPTNDDTADESLPAVKRDIKKDPYIKQIVSEATAKQQEAQKLENERLAEIRRIEAARLEEQRLEEQRREKERLAAEAREKILALPAELIDIPGPQDTFIPVPRVVHRTRVITQPVPDYLVMKADIESALGPVQVAKLIRRARSEIQKGDVLMAHTFAEAAAETEIPLDLFKKKPDVILAEIEYVTARRHSTGKATQVNYDEQESSIEDGNTEFNKLKKNSRAYRALSEKSLNINVAENKDDGTKNLVPLTIARHRMAKLPEVFQNEGFGRGWNSICYSWEAPVVSHSPLYFEDPELERYGNEFCAGLQPIKSGLDFFFTIPSLPYQMGIEGNGPFACVYDLGYERPGECVPYSIHRLPFSWTGAAVQGAATTGLVFVWP